MLSNKSHDAWRDIQIGWKFHNFERNMTFLVLLFFNVYIYVLCILGFHTLYREIVIYSYLCIYWLNVSYDTVDFL